MASLPLKTVLPHEVDIILNSRYARFYMASHEQGGPSREFHGPNYDFLQNVWHVARGRYNQATETYNFTSGTVVGSIVGVNDTRVVEFHSIGGQERQSDMITVRDGVLPAIGTVMLGCEQLTDDAPPTAEVQWRHPPMDYTAIIITSEDGVVKRQEELQDSGLITYHPEPHQTSDDLSADLSVMLVIDPMSPTGEEYTRLAAEFGAESAGRNLLNGALEYVGGVVLPAVQQLQRDNGDPSAAN